MILDATLLFSDAQAITVDAGSTNTIDFGAAATSFSGQTQLRDVGPGNPIYVWASVDTTFVTLVSLTVSAQTDDNTSFSSAVTLWSTPAILLATLVAGYRFSLPPINQRGVERYLRLFYDVSTSATAGAITAGLTLGQQHNPTN